MNVVGFLDMLAWFEGTDNWKQLGEPAGGSTSASWMTCWRPTAKPMACSCHDRGNRPVVDGLRSCRVLGGKGNLGGALLSRRKERTVTDANVDLLNGLVQRVNSLEESQAATTLQLAEEIKLHMTAQEEAHRLRLRVKLVKSATCHTTRLSGRQPHRHAVADIGLQAAPLMRE